MTKSVEQLILTLEKESEIYREILEISTKKREAIRGNQIENLEALAGHEQALVVTLFKLEELREKVLDLILRELKIDHIENVTQLAQFLLPEERQKVLSAKDELIVLVKNTVDENRFNNRMIEDKLDLIEFNIGMLTQMSDDSGKYDKKAVNEAYERKNIFDARV
ncbi:MAG: flagellar protein FlgN [Clostridia bacterium]|nr:flagellar protein FlgN [Clostridia bacterium]